MGQRDMEEIAQGVSEFRAVRVELITGRSEPAREHRPVVLTVQNDWDTLDYVKDNLGAIASNAIKTRQSEEQQRQEADDSEELFSRNLHPLFTLISATASNHVMDKLSASLKKALLLMAMERYSCDSDSICRVLGISRGKLEKELQRCGLSRAPKKEG